MTTPERPFYPQEGPMWPEQRMAPIVVLAPPKLAPWTNREVAEYQALTNATIDFTDTMLDWASREH